MRSVAQESPDSELWLKRYGGKKFRGLNQNFGKIHWHIWKYRKFGGILCKFGGPRGILELFS
jgi:hypothetical protein